MFKWLIFVYYFYLSAKISKISDFSKYSHEKRASSLGECSWYVYRMPIFASLKSAIS